MDKLTPSAQRTLDALQTGPGNVHELSERTGRSRSTTDKAIADLARAGLIVKVDDGGDPADGAPARWQLADPADGETPQPQATGGGHATEPDSATADVGTVGEATGAASPDGPPEPETNSQPIADPPAPSGDTNPTPTTAAEPDSTATSDSAARHDGDQAEAETPKLCRGCQAQMPTICESCWQKTPAYCGQCRRTMPQVRRGEPGEPIILSNGLPKLRPGELEKLVEKVMRDHPLPAFAGVVGWTGGRVAVHLPGRSSGAINNALQKLERTGVAELIGDTPMRYQLKPTGETDTAPNPATNTDRGHAEDKPEAVQPAAGAEAPQSDTSA
jgi:hypothetical protein